MIEETATENGDRPKDWPRLLPDDASHADMVKAINGLAYELQMIRISLQGHGTRIEDFCVATAKQIELVCERVLNALTGKAAT